MPVTPNFGWITPTVAGDLGAWGTILNTALAEVDTDLFAALGAKANLGGANTFTGAQTMPVAVVGPDPGGTERLRVRDAMRVGSPDVIPQVIIDCPNAAGGFEGRVTYQRAGVTRFGALYDRDADEYRIASASGTAVRVTQGGNVSVAGTLAAGGVISTPGSVTIGGVFNGSGAGLSSVPWGALLGVPSNVANAITQAQGDARYKLLTDQTAAWAAISGIPSNVVNAITQAQGDARYRQIGGAVPWADITGAPTFIRTDVANTFSAAQTFTQTVVLDAATAFRANNSVLDSSLALTPDLVMPDGVTFGVPDWRWIRCNVAGRTGYVPVLFDDVI